ncbi:MAG: exodeoxyribonuclease VII small subunit [Lentisphaeria bacterium]
MSVDKELNFEDAMQRLEVIVSAMESGKLSIDDCIALYSEAGNLVKFCENKLGDFEKKVEVLTSTDDQGHWENLQ